MVELLNYQYIVDNSYLIERNRTGIYFLIYKNKIVYVGKTTRGLERTYSHLSCKIFDKIYFIPCLLENLNKLEAMYILKFNPEYNVNISNSNYYLTISNIKLLLKEIGLKYTDKRKISKYINENKIKKIYFNNKMYIEKNNFNDIRKYMEGFNNAMV